MDAHDVVIAGGGPTGTVLAAELVLAGVDVVVVEPRTSHRIDGSRAGGLHARTLEELDQRGVVDRFLAEGQTHPFVGYGLVPLGIGDFPTRHPYVLGLWQSHIERILGGWVAELGVRFLRGRSVVGFDRDDHGVDVGLDDGSSLRARYLVGCDGGRSVVRTAAGIDFAGLDPSTSWMIAEVELDDGAPFGVTRDDAGTHAMARRDPADPVRVVITERGVPTGRPSLDDLRAAMEGVWGSDLGVRDVSWISRFTDVSRQAADYRRGRVLLAGDAAHVHPPQGGQGLNVGVQDAVNLGWKLARVVHGSSSEEVLDTYHDERHPVGARVLQNTSAQVALATPDDRHAALRDMVGELLVLDEPRRRTAAMISGLDVRYDLGGEHPLVGRRMPDLDLVGAPGSASRVYELLPDARPVLLRLAGGHGFDPGPWTDRVRAVDARTDGPWVLPVVGEVPAPASVLVRPDGYVAWAGEPADPDLPAALERWFGPPAST